jgi:acetyl-CoA C-acetyltransferase
MENIVITSAARTPIGGLLGVFKDMPAPLLGAVAIKAALERAGLQPIEIDAVLMGCVLSAGQGQAPARQAALAAGLPYSTGCTTINKMCGSGMQAIMLAHDALIAGTYKTIIAGGMESMSCAPYLLPKARRGYRLGHAQLIDHLLLDGLEDAYEKGVSMGQLAEDCVSRYQFTRAEQDQFAACSVQRAQQADFSIEIAPVTLSSGQVITTDETSHKAHIDVIPALPPVFKTDGTITAASSSKISDGAAAVSLMSQSHANLLKLKPLARIAGFATHAQDPHWFTTAPAEAIKKLLDKIGWSMQEIDLFEINEAFAVVTMAAMRELNLPAEKVNIHGGACAMGHPIGASGARIVVTLLAALEKQGLKRGIAALCIGGGEATAIAVERL